MRNAIINSATTTKSPTFLYFYCLLISLPIVTEVIRRFFSFEEYWLAISDVVAVLSLVLIVSNRGYSPLRLLSNVFFALIGLILWMVFSAIVGHQNPMILIVGIRSVLIPVVYLAISVMFVSQYGSRALDYFLTIVGFWIVISLGMAIAQLALGPSHQINQITFTGSYLIADYTVDDYGIEGLFRPSSIFLHPGKFGQVAYILSSFVIICSLLSEKRVGFQRFLVVCSLALIIISGQRAAFVFLFFVFIIVLFIKTGRNGVGGGVFITLFWSLLVLIAAVIGVAIYDYDALFLIVERFGSGFLEIGFRLIENGVDASASVFGRYLVMGEGAGFYSLGASSFGGLILFDLVTVFYSAENSWLRIVAEMGFFGLMLTCFFYGAMVFRIVINYLSLPNDQFGNGLLPMILFAGCFIFSIVGWAFTHDILGSVVTMSIGAALSGTGFVDLRIVRAGTTIHPNPFAQLYPSSRNTSN